MRKKIIFGSVFAVVVIIFASFSSVASVRTINSNNLIENIKDKIENSVWVPGFFITWFILFFYMIGLLMMGAFRSF